MRIYLSFLFLLCFNILSYGQIQRNFDGEVGVSFLKNTFSKTVIDFNTMTIECED